QPHPAAVELAQPQGDRPALLALRPLQGNGPLRRRQLPTQQGGRQVEDQPGRPRELEALQLDGRLRLQGETEPVPRRPDPELLDSPYTALFRSRRQSLAKPPGTKDP